MSNSSEAFLITSISVDSLRIVINSTMKCTVMILVILMACPFESAPVDDRKLEKAGEAGESSKALADKLSQERGVELDEIPEFVDLEIDNDNFDYQAYLGGLAELELRLIPDWDKDESGELIDIDVSDFAKSKDRSAENYDFEYENEDELKVG